MRAMPWLFLCVTILGALLTLNAYFPIRRWARTGMFSFALGWPTAELAMHHVAWQVLVTVVFVRAGALQAWAGQLGLGIAFANWLGLGWDYASGWKTRQVFRSAFDDAFGPGWREHIRPSLAEKIARVSLRQLLVPLPVTHPEVAATEDITFYEEPAFRLRLDVFRHRSKPTNTPALIYVHGGAWVIGDKSNQGLPLMQHMAALGWTCFGINYRLSPRATFPDHLLDVKRAIAWVREHGAEYGADPDFVIICGGSAGGHLAALAALSSQERSFQPGFEDADCSVSGCVPLYGVFDFADHAKVWPHLGLTKLVAKYVMKARPAHAPTAWDRASPIFWVSDKAPPFLIVHGTRDSLVPIGEARNFARRLREVTRAPVALAEVPGAQHAFDIFPSPRAACTVEGIAEFGMVLYSRYLEAREQRPIALEASPAAQPPPLRADVSPPGNAPRHD
jgi:acetyl esterase/lipase